MGTGRPDRSPTACDVATTYADDYIIYKYMILMVQMFVAMHREHLVSVRDELDRVKQLTRELSDLQGKLVPTPGSGEVDSPPSVDAAAKARAVQTSDKHRQVPIRDVPEPTQLGKRTSKRSPGVVRSAGLTVPVPSVVGNQGEPRDDRSSTADHTEIHALLTKRITELQRERQGYWQRILSVISK
jgi:hypothetical protein